MGKRRPRRSAPHPTPPATAAATVAPAVRARVERDALTASGRVVQMGWRSWNAFGNRITQDMMHTAIDAITAKNWTASDGSKISLADAGYASVGASAAWAGR